MNRFGFVILHYQTERETIECIESIRKISNSMQYEIIVVDNGSSNHSGENIQKKYLGIKNFNIIFSKENIGFARGNNLGITYAKNILKCNFIILLNNDTKILQKNFLDLINREYEKSLCAVIGPCILKDGTVTNDNPRRTAPLGKSRLYLFILINRLLLFLNYLRLDILPNSLFSFYIKWKKKKLASDSHKRQENVSLHGCCLIFTPMFLSKEQGLNPETFMYMEEDILYEKMYRLKMKTVYLPDLKIEHKDAIATNGLYKKSYKKRRFIYKNTLYSANILRKQMKTEI